jgi:hypothetical protein
VNLWLFNYNFTTTECKKLYVASFPFNLFADIIQALYHCCFVHVG